MKPSAMLYRNLLSIEIEEIIRSYPLDGIVLLAGCDKTVPGAIMGAVSADLPMVLVTSGSRAPATFRGRRIGTGSDLWRLWDERRAGRLDDAGWRELERCLACGTGTCNTMGTASTMAILAETLGLMIPGSATIPAGYPRGRAAAAAAGRCAVEAVAAQAAVRHPDPGRVRQRHPDAARGRRFHQRDHPPGRDRQPGRYPAAPRRPGPSRPGHPGTGRRGTLRRRAPARPGPGGRGPGPAPGTGRTGWTRVRSPSPAPRSPRSPAPLPPPPGRSGRPGCRRGTTEPLP